jgi:membrane-bound lytic murein transglycosylase A
LYSVPEQLIKRKDPATGKTRVGRADNKGNLVPFWSRREIDGDGILKGDELVYLKDPMDAYMLHIQGSGRVRLQDGSIRSIHYGASNGRGYKSLGKLFVDRKIMKLKEVSIPAIRAYFDEHPEDITQMLYHNPRYIFFKWGDDKGPRGSIGEILTPGRSIAIDHDTFPAGAIGYLVSKKPVLDKSGSIESWITFSRIVFPQDSGSAIKGPGRVDLFMGNGQYAETAASHMKEEGKFYLLIQNSCELPQKSGTLSLITDTEQQVRYR